MHESEYGSNTVFIGNIGPNGSCNYNTAASGHNVWKTQKCSVTDTFAPTIFTNSSFWVGFTGALVVTQPWDWRNHPDQNYHITSGSPAVNAGDPANFPTTDKDGVPRPNPPDAGPYQH